MEKVYKPILFSTEMVKQILAGKKTQTRRNIRFNKEIKVDHIGWSALTPKNHYSVRGTHNNGQWGESFFKEPYRIGQILWVRETWVNFHGNYFYKADGFTHNGTTHKKITWKPSIFMPKYACRLFLKIENVHCEKLQNISEGDCYSEGVSNNDLDLTSEQMYYNYCNPSNRVYGDVRKNFERLWKSINGDKNWEENPWVWVIKFKVIHNPQPELFE